MKKVIAEIGPFDQGEYRPVPGVLTSENTVFFIDREDGGNVWVIRVEVLDKPDLYRQIGAFLLIGRTDRDETVIPEIVAMLKGRSAYDFVTHELIETEYDIELNLVPDA
ncbi:hypothetical protein [Paenibacillus qinlingensis]|uniref:hypothetical protein n=1 Tax=Paenibacillus qinlingensis TaxID=1837343 RepID=UPI0015631083|nr:hypothetical protein [Paenibacillus qinlingensis]NQX61827.1 hypothetical protein [Paenibacillus qinlingensis]